MTVWTALFAGAVFSLAGGTEPSDQKVAPPSPLIRVDSERLVAACVSPRDRSRPIASFSAAQRRRMIVCLQAAAAAQANGQLPVQVDEVTRLERITTSGPILVYHYSVALRRADLAPDAARQMETTTRENVCAQDAMRRTMQQGGAYGYRWVDSDGVLIHQLRINAC